MFPVFWCKYNMDIYDVHLIAFCCYLYFTHLFILIFCNLGCRMHLLIAKEIRVNFTFMYPSEKAECIYFLLSGYVLLGEQRHLKIHGDLKR